MSGLGAWSYGSYKVGMDVDDRVAAGIFAFKQELIYRGFGQGIKLDLPVYGNMIEARVKDFQTTTNGALRVDGEIGSKTARYLFWTRANKVALNFSIPQRLLAKLGTLESANDPVAQGYVDPDDEGWAQIHMSFHPEITVEQAHDPSFAIPWAGAQLAAAADYCDDDWDGGVAAHNIGWFYARQWVRDQKPASGGPLIGDADSYERATRYVALVKRQPVF